MNTAVALAVSGTVAAVVEETFFRGWIFTIVRRRLGPGTTIIIISLLFALSHLFLKVHWLRIATFFPGLVMGYLRERTENIVPGMIYHGIGNIWSIWFFPGM
jgi:membrane protease YdiL (CAAX protease family)